MTMLLAFPARTYLREMRQAVVYAGDVDVAAASGEAAPADRDKTFERVRASPVYCKADRGPLDEVCVCTA